jgi:hypothetical protein
MVLFDPASHEPLTDEPWSEARARETIARIVDDSERAFRRDSLWPMHPLDVEGEPEPPIASLYLGATGVLYALDALERAGAARLQRNWAPVATALYERYLERPDFADNTGGRPVPSFWMGEAGILLVAHYLAPAAWQEERLLACVRENASNPTRELMWGSPGTMLAAATMYERTGRNEYAAVWRESADWLLAEWREDLWQQELSGRSVYFLGPAHGFAGNVHALARGELLGSPRRQEVEQRAAAVAAKFAEREDGLAQWAPTRDAGPKRGGVPTQWCHGAPGVVASLARIAADDSDHTDLLVAGGGLTWRAGPLVKGAGLCHGTAGNGYAFLKLFERTGDELWLDRARAFAVHAAQQVERDRSRYGRGRYTLWTGDLGTALFVQSCIDACAAIPTLD